MNDDVATTALARLAREQAVQRIWERESTLWKADPAVRPAIRNRLGWLTVPRPMAERTRDLRAFADQVRAAGYRQAVLLGMGGSSLCPEVLRRTFGVGPGGLDLQVLDTTDPLTIGAVEQSARRERTLFVVATKSGTTIETLAQYRFFADRLRTAASEDSLGEESIEERVGQHFVAITDPGSPLERLAAEQGFRRTFLNPPDIGGRYSALSYFGLVPAALLGVDLDELLARANAMADACRPEVPAAENPGLALGAALGGWALQGRDKVTLVVSPARRAAGPDQGGLESFGYWAEQLLAESTGKEGKGLIPVEGEPVGPPSVYGQDRLFVYLRLEPEADEATDRAVQALEAAGHPVVRLPLGDRFDLGAEFFRWEFATAVAGALLGINPFDEPNVQESKDNTSHVLAEWRATGRLPEPMPRLAEGPLALVCDEATWTRIAPLAEGSLSSALAGLLRLVQPGDYLALLTYLPRTAESEETLRALRTGLRDARRVATTVGFGPRFLHSTGQLHKGGPDAGVFLQITGDDPVDLPVPGEPYSFSVLKRAQALGDLQALQRHGRRAVRVHLAGDPPAGLAALARVLGIRG